MTRIVCAWCGALMAPGSEPVSHGLCPKCEARVFSDPIPADADLGDLRDLHGHPGGDRDEPPCEPDDDPAT